MTEEEYYNQFLYGGWSPHDYGTVWLENGAYANLERELAYYRSHPNNVNPDELLQFLAQVLEEWRQDRRNYQNAMEEVLNRYEEMLEAMRDREREYRRLKDVLKELREQLRRQQEQQRQLEHRIRQVEEERENNQRRAVDLRNEAVEAFNRIVNDPYFQKYAIHELEAISHQLEELDRLPLAAEAKQAVALDCLNRVFTVIQLVERKKLEFSTARLLAETEATLIMDQFIHWRDDVYFDEQRQHKADMDFWSFEHFGEVMRAVEALQRRIHDGELMAGYYVENLKEDLQQMKDLQEEGEQTVASVFNNCNVSEECQQLALIAATILYEDFHFKLIANGYDADDMRHGYVIEMENHALGCKLRFVFSPVSETQSVGCYQLCFLDYIDQILLSSFERMLLSELEYNKIPVRTRRKQGEETIGTIVEELEFTPYGQPILLPQEMRLWESNK